ncbi:MAG: cell wall hydrolase [Devosia sp.]
MRATALNRALFRGFVVGAVALASALFAIPAQSEDLQLAYVTPAELTPQLAAERQQQSVPLRPSFSAQPPLTNDLLAAYVARQQKLSQFSVFDATSSDELTEQVLLSYIDRTRGPTNLALDAINAVTGESPLTPDALSVYARKYVPTIKKVQFTDAEKLCLTQAIYHEARGESEEGQWAVANVIINRAMSHKFPTTLCGVVFQNADQGYHHCQFTFACDGRSDMGNETAAWNRAVKMAQVAFREFQQGETPGVLPNSTLFYHTTAVDPAWSSRLTRVAVIGAHEFYSPN